MMKFAFRKSHTKRIAVADIGSASAGFALLELSSGGPARVVHSSRATIPIEERTPQATMAAISAELLRIGQETMNNRAKAGDTGRPESIYCVLRAPWSFSESVRADSSYEGDVEVAEEMIKELAHQALARGSTVNTENFLEANVAQVRLNGYPTASPEGKFAHSIAVVGLVSGSEQWVRASLQGTLDKLLPHTPIVWRSGARALIAAIQAAYPHRDEYFAAEVGGEGTMFAVVREGAPEKQCFVPQGVNAVIRAVSKKGTLPEDTLSLIRMIGRDQCERSQCDELIKDLARTEPELMRSFGECMAKCAEPRKLPDRMVLFAHTDMAQWLARFFA
ncbi:MAG: hypothetical protein U1D26_00185, partial [Patescibacteria group bacterium]|nr:hypothetical protein [Patescibacteria group bacterium]